MTVQLQRYELYKFVFNLMVILSSMIWEYSKIIVLVEAFDLLYKRVHMVNDTNLVIWLLI